MVNRTEQRRQRRLPGGRRQRIVVRVDEVTWSKLKDKAVEAGRSLPAYLVEVGLRPAVTSMSLAGQRAMADQLDTVLTRLRQSGNLLNQYTARLHTTGEVHGGLDALLAYHRQTVDQLATLVVKFDGR